MNLTMEVEGSLPNPDTQAGLVSVLENCFCPDTKESKVSI